MDGSSVIAYSSLAREVNYHLISSFAFLLWEIAITWEDEIKHIWLKPCDSIFKWLYLYLRYITFAAQLFHQLAVPYLNSGEASRSSCFVWYIYTTLLAQFHTTIVEVILAIRVYALFNKSRRIAVILGLQMSLEYIMLIVVIGKYFSEILFIPYCLLSQPPFPIVYQTIIILTTQTTLVGLILAKRILARHTGWGRTPLVSVLIRDGTTTYFITCIIFFAIALVCELRDKRSVIIFFWLITIISSWGCRLIVNMQSLADDDNPRRPSATPSSHITSYIEVEPPSQITLRSS